MTPLFSPIPPPTVATRLRVRRRLRLDVRPEQSHPILSARHAAQARRPRPIGHDGTTTLHLPQSARATAR